MEDLAVFKALNHSGSFGKNFVKFKKYTRYLPANCRSNYFQSVKHSCCFWSPGLFEF